MHNFDLDIQLYRSDEKVCVGGGAKGVAHDQEGKVLLRRLRNVLQNLVDRLLAGLAVCLYNAAAVELFEGLTLHTQDGCVGLQVHALAAFDYFETLARDVTLVAKAKSDYVEHHRNLRVDVDQ